MNEITLRQIAQWTDGRLVGGDRTINDVSIDSRSITDKSMFIAIEGERFDAHSFIGEVEKSGAAAVMCHKQVECSIPVIYVEDTAKAFLELAREYRKSIKNLTVIGLTGSVGKTTTKEMTHAVVSKKFNAIKTEGNLNNEIGMPKTLLRLDDSINAAVIEMGMSHFGEISRLTSASLPDIGIITNIGVSHIEYLGSRDGILKAKLEILEGMKKGSALILNGDNDKLVTVKNDDYKIKFFSVDNENADVRAINIDEQNGKTNFDVCFGERKQSVILPTAGIHNVYDSLAAFCVGLELGISSDEIAAALSEYTPSGMRQLIKNIDGITVIEDCYNASPDSQRAALNVLANMKAKRKIAVLGDMLELGSYSKTAHSEVGDYVAQKNIDMLFAYGKEAQYIAEHADNGSVKVRHFTDKTELFNALKDEITTGDAVIFKASRGMKLEEVIEMLYKEWEDK